MDAPFEFESITKFKDTSLRKPFIRKLHEIGIDGWIAGFEKLIWVWLWQGTSSA
jgi:hypothetical protein